MWYLSSRSDEKSIRVPGHGVDTFFRNVCNRLQDKASKFRKSQSAVWERFFVYYKYCEFKLHNNRKKTDVAYFCVAGLYKNEFVCTIKGEEYLLEFPRAMSPSNGQWWAVTKGELWLQMTLEARNVLWTTYPCIGAQLYCLQHPDCFYSDIILPCYSTEHQHLPTQRC